jgi:eukaryotic-like serine/threonine-protein kinase
VVLKGELLSKPTYQVIQTIHEGDTGLCYKFWHDIFACWKAQKTVSLIGLGDALAHQEPTLLHELNHRYLTEIHEAQWDPEYGDKYITFIMPYYEGGSLHSVLQGGYRFSLGEAIRVTSQVADALHYLHVTKRLLHRDVKPGNIFLAGDLHTAYLGDLGCAAPMSEGGWAEFRGGTPLYRAPECSVNRYVPASDLYSLGLALLEMINGPFDYARIDFNDVYNRLAAGRRSLPDRHLEVAPHTPEVLRRIINGLLHRDPNRRISNAWELQRKLHDVVHLDWREMAGEDGRTWMGVTPSSPRRRTAREVEAIARTVNRGRYAGLIELSARWRLVGQDRWRKLRGRTVRIQPEDQTAWRSFFKSVSTDMLQSSARR